MGDRILAGEPIQVSHARTQMGPFAVTESVWRTAAGPFRCQDPDGPIRGYHVCMENGLLASGPIQVSHTWMGPLVVTEASWETGY
jgi:hypothetical protein